MKKKALALIIVLALILSMTAMAGCGSSSDADSSDGTTSSTGTETPEDTEDVSSEETDAVDETSSSGEVLTVQTLTEEDMLEFYSSIKRSVETRYLEPNNISPEDFSWPEEDSEVWNYIRNVHNEATIFMFDMVNGSDIANKVDEDELLENLSEIEGYSSSPEKDILDAVLFGTIEWLESKGDYEVGVFSYLWNFINYSNLSKEVTFD